MALLIFALSLFIITHLIPVFPLLKSALIAKMGHAGYIVIFSILSLFSLGLIIYAKAEAPFIDIYTPPPWARHFALMLMLPATILAVASLLPGHIAKIVRAPIFFATALWVIAHLVANGDKASILLFGSLGAYACLSQVFKRPPLEGDKHKGKAENIWADFAAVAGGILIYAGLLHLHEYAIGVPVLF